MAAAAAAVPSAAAERLPPSCPICLEALQGSDAVVLSACASEVPQHACCTSCFTTYVDMALRWASVRGIAHVKSLQVQIEGLPACTCTFNCSWPACSLAQRDG